MSESSGNLKFSSVDLRYLSELTVLTETREIIYAFGQYSVPIFSAAISLRDMQMNPGDSVLRPRKQRNHNVRLFIPPLRCCPSRKRTCRPRTFGYPCFGLGRSVGYRRHFVRRLRESCRGGAAHPSELWRFGHPHRTASRLVGRASRR